MEIRRVGTRIARHSNTINDVVHLVIESMIEHGEPSRSLPIRSSSLSSLVLRDRLIRGDRPRKDFSSNP